MDLQTAREITEHREEIKATTRLGVFIDKDALDRYIDILSENERSLV